MKEKRTLVVYHYFAHYRSGILKQLIDDGGFDFAGSDFDYESKSKDKIEVFNDWPKDTFIHTPIFRIKGSYVFQRGLIKLVLSKRYNTIIFLGDAHFISTWVSALLSRLLGIRTIFWTTGWHKPDTGMIKYLRKVFYKIPHALLLYSDYSRRIALTLGFSSKDIYVIYNSLDYKVQSQVRKSINRNEAKIKVASMFKNPDLPVIICTSRLTKKRRIDLLIEASKILKDANTPINVLIVGDGSERDSILSLANRINVGDNLILYGACYQEETLAELIMGSHLTVAPGMVGLTAIHSLTYGVPVITHNDPNNQAPEWEAIIEGLTGDFFEMGDANDLAKKINSWIIKENNATDVNCIEIVDKIFNPERQHKIIQLASAGIDANTPINRMADINDYR